MGPKRAVIVEPVDPAQGGHFDCRRVWPRSLPPDDLGFVEAVDGLGQGVVVAVAEVLSKQMHLIEM